MGTRKRATIELTREDEQRLARIRDATGMCQTVNIREALHLLDAALSESTHIRSVFIPSSYGHLWRPEDFDVELALGERIINIETIPPNSAVGSGTRVWIRCLDSE